MLDHPDFVAGRFNLNFIQDNPELLDNLPGAPSARDTKETVTLGQKYDSIEGYLKYIANLAVNGHPKSLGADPALVRTIENRNIPGPSSKTIQAILDGKKKGNEGMPTHWRKILREQGPKALAKAVREHQNVLVTDTTW